MEHYDFDLVVIGGGSAGYAGARTAHAEGLKVAVIDVHACSLHRSAKWPEARRHAQPRLESAFNAEGHCTTGQ